MGQHRAGSNHREWEAGGWGVGGYWRAGESHRFWNDIRADIFPLFFIALLVSLVSHYSSLPRIFKSVSLCQRIWFRSHVRPVSPEFLMCFLVLSSHRVLPPFSASFLRCCLLCFVFMDLWSYHWSTFFVSYLPISCLPLNHHPLFVNHYKSNFCEMQLFDDTHHLSTRWIEMRRALKGYSNDLVLYLKDGWFTRNWI